LAAYDFDLFTIGAGSGGVAASRRAASYGAKVAIAESARVAGTCVLRGCVPKKLLVHGTHVREEIEDAAGYGWTIGASTLDWAKLIAAKNRELDRLNGVYIKLLTDSRVTILDGHARLDGHHRVRVGDKTYSARHILIATGGRPEPPSIPGAELGIDSDRALDLPGLPASIAIIGGGYIAVEFAGIFRAAGARVTLLVRGPSILRGFDGDIQAHLAAEMAKKGIEIRTGQSPARLERRGSGLALTTRSGESLVADQVMFATGRKPNTAELGLENVGVHVNKRQAIAVDEWRRATVPDIFAIGDCTDRLNLTPVAIAEGRALAETLFNANPMPTDHANVPTAVFSQPPVGTVGMTEEAARAQGEVEIYRATFRPMKHALSGRDEKTMMKLVVERASQRVLGCHMVGADAPEIVQGLAIAVRAGLTKRDFDRTMAIHPTAAEEFVLMREPLKPAVARAAE
jgi:glutathione reductase (NADPH)